MLEENTITQNSSGNEVGNNLNSNQHNLNSPSNNRPKQSSPWKIVIIFLVLALIGGAGYLAYSKSSINLFGGDKESKNYKKISLSTSTHLANDSIKLKFDQPKEWINVSKTSPNYQKYYYDIDLAFFPSTEDQIKEESYITSAKNLSINNPDDVNYLRTHPAYERMFQRDNRVIQATFYKASQSINLKSNDSSITGVPVFDKVLVDNKKVGNTQYHCLQSKKDDKYLINCTLNLNNSYMATASLFTNNASYDNDLSALYRFIETLSVN